MRKKVFKLSNLKINKAKFSVGQTLWFQPGDLHRPYFSDPITKIGCKYVTTQHGCIIDIATMIWFEKGQQTGFWCGDFAFSEDEMLPHHKPKKQQPIAVIDQTAIDIIVHKAQLKRDTLPDINYRLYLEGVLDAAIVIHGKTFTEHTLRQLDQHDLLTVDGLEYNLKNRLNLTIPKN